MVIGHLPRVRIVVKALYVASLYHGFRAHITARLYLLVVGCVSLC